MFFATDEDGDVYHVEDANQPLSNGGPMHME